jgi:hypothetical protein
MDHADRLAERWYEECQEQGLPTDSYHPLKAGLRAFLPADAPAGIAYRDEHPFVLALAPETLLFFAPPAADQLLDAFALPIASICSLAVGSAHASTVRSNYRLCTWTLREADGTARVHQTRRVIGNGFDPDNGGEAVMLGLSQCLGWPTPLYQKEEK